jgi:hypothetical protein
MARARKVHKVNPVSRPKLCTRATTGGARKTPDIAAARNGVRRFGPERENLHWSSALNQSDENYHYGYHQQRVNVAAKGVGTDNAEQP